MPYFAFVLVVDNWPFADMSNNTPIANDTGSNAANKTRLSPKAAELLQGQLAANLILKGVLVAVVSIGWLMMVCALIHNPNFPLAIATTGTPFAVMNTLCRHFFPSKPEHNSSSSHPASAGARWRVRAAPGGGP